MGLAVIIILSSCKFSKQKHTSIALFKFFNSLDTITNRKIPLATLRCVLLTVYKYYIKSTLKLA